MTFCEQDIQSVATVDYLQTFPFDGRVIVMFRSIIRLLLFDIQVHSHAGNLQLLLFTLQLITAHSKSPYSLSRGVDCLLCKSKLCL